MRNAMSADYGVILWPRGTRLHNGHARIMWATVLVPIAHLPISRRGHCSIRQRLTDVFPHHRIETEKGAEFIHPYDDPRVCMHVSC
jgi:hypothetical protein